MRKKLLLILLIFTLTFVSTTALAQDDRVYLRVAHFSVDAGAVDIYVDGEVAVENLVFPEITEWMELAAGTYSIAVAPSDTSIDAAVIGPADFELPAGEWFTIAAIGEVTHDTLTTQVLVEDFSEMADGETRVSFFNGIPHSQPVNVFANDVELSRLLGYPGFFGPDSDGFATVDIVAGTYTVAFTLEDDTTVVNVPDVNMGAGRNYFFAVVGLASRPLYVLNITDPAGMMGEGNTEKPIDEVTLGEGPLNLRVAHLSPGAPAVDIYINGALSDFTNLQFPSLSVWVEFQAGIYDIAVAPAGTSIDDAIFKTQVGLAADTWTTLMAVGLLADDSFSVQPVLEDFSPTGTGMTRMSVIHAIPDGPPVNLTANDEVMVQALAFPSYASMESDGYASVTVIAQEYTIQITDANGDVLLDVGTYTLAPNANYLVIATGLATTPLFLLEKTEIPTE